MPPSARLWCMFGSFNLPSAVLSSNLGDLFSIFPSLVPRSAWLDLKSPEHPAFSLLISINVLFFLSSETALQVKDGWIHLHPHIFPDFWTFMVSSICPVQLSTEPFCAPLENLNLGQPNPPTGTSLLVCTLSSFYHL